MKLLILFVTLLLGVSLNLMAEEKSNKETGKRPPHETEASIDKNQCCATPQASGMLSDKECEALLYKDKLNGLSQADSDEVQRKCKNSTSPSKKSGDANANK